MSNTWDGGLLGRSISIWIWLTYICTSWEFVAMLIWIDIYHRISKFLIWKSMCVMIWGFWMNSKSYVLQIKYFFFWLLSVSFKYTQIDFGLVFVKNNIQTLVEINSNVFFVPLLIVRTAERNKWFYLFLWLIIIHDYLGGIAFIPPPHTIYQYQWDSTVR